MIRSRAVWMTWGAFATACAAMDTYPADLANGASHAPEEPPEVDASSPAQQPALSTSSLDGGPAPDAGSMSTTPPLDDPHACIVWGARDSNDEGSTWRESWDATTRVRTRHATAAPDSPRYLAWRYSADARVLAYVGSNFQHDYQYDEHGNATDFRLSYSEPDLFTRFAGEPWMGTSITNEYSGSAALAASTLTQYGEGNATSVPVHKIFAEDEQGRCVHVETKRGSVDTLETREYDSAGRLSTVRVGSTDSLTHNDACKSTLETHEYDDAGRIERVERRCDRGTPSLAFYRQTHAYEDDGTVTIETFNFDTDVGNGSPSVEKRGPGCASMDAAITRTDTACDPLM